MDLYLSGSRSRGPWAPSKAKTKVGAPAWGPSLCLPPGAPQGPRRLVSCDGLAAFSSSPFSFPRACSPLPLGARGAGQFTILGAFFKFLVSQEIVRLFAVVSWCVLDSRFWVLGFGFGF